MVDALVSGASVERRAGSSPVLGTIHKENVTAVTFSFLYPNSSPNDGSVEKYWGWGFVS